MTLDAWKQLMGSEPSLDDVVRLYSLFRIATLDVNPDEADEQHARTTLATAILAETQESAKGWSSLVSAMGAESEIRRTLLQQDIRRLLVEADFDPGSDSRLHRHPSHCGPDCQLRQALRNRECTAAAQVLLRGIGSPAGLLRLRRPGNAKDLCAAAPDCGTEPLGGRQERGGPKSLLRLRSTGNSLQ